MKSLVISRSCHESRPNFWSLFWNLTIQVCSLWLIRGLAQLNGRLMSVCTRHATMSSETCHQNRDKGLADAAWSCRMTKLWASHLHGSGLLENVCISIDFISAVPRLLTNPGLSRHRRRCWLANSENLDREINCCQATSARTGPITCSYHPMSVCQASLPCIGKADWCMQSRRCCATASRSLQGPSPPSCPTQTDIMWTKHLGRMDQGMRGFSGGSNMAQGIESSLHGQAEVVVLVLRDTSS